MQLPHRALAEHMACEIIDAFGFGPSDATLLLATCGFDMHLMQARVGPAGQRLCVQKGFGEAVGLRLLG